MEQVKEWELQFRFSCFDSFTFTNTLTSVQAVVPLTWPLINTSFTLQWEIWARWQTLEAWRRGLWLKSAFSNRVKLINFAHFRGAATAMKSLMKKRKVQQRERRKPSEKLSTWTKVKIALSSVRKSKFCNAIHSRTWIHISPAWVQPCNVCMICNRQRMPFWGHVKHNKHLRSFFDKSTGTRTWVVCSVPTVSWAWDNLSYISFYT